MQNRQRLAETYDQMLREQLPNLFRLYLNPYVVQTCFCLERYIQDTWHASADRYQAFLANSFDEALSGAIKLVRYCTSVAGRSTTGLVIDPTNKLGPFASAGSVVFLPGLTVVHGDDTAVPEDQSFGFVVLVAGGDLAPHADSVRRLVREGAPPRYLC